MIIKSHKVTPEEIAALEKLVQLSQQNSGFEFHTPAQSAPKSLAGWRPKDSSAIDRPNFKETRIEHPKATWKKQTSSIIRDVSSRQVGPSIGVGPNHSPSIIGPVTNQSLNPNTVTSQGPVPATSIGPSAGPSFLRSSAGANIAVTQSPSIPAPPDSIPTLSSIPAPRSDPLPSSELSPETNLHPQSPRYEQVPASQKHLFSGDLQFVEVTRQPLEYDPVRWLILLMPELKPHKWQFEELLRATGYLDAGSPGFNLAISRRQRPTVAAPFLGVYSCANNSGKDSVIIAALATWFAISGVRNRAIITSSSYEQIKFQTEPGIRELINRANKKFGKLFRSVEFHHIVPELGSEIKLFATDEKGRAEGYHPWHGGNMLLIENEAKTIKDEIHESLDRCTGYSHRLIISSPAARAGFMYKIAQIAMKNGLTYPAKAELGKWYFRKVTAFDCSHIPLSDSERTKEEYGEESPIYKSKVLAEFSDLDTPVVIPESVFNECFLNPPAPAGDDIGIGGDVAAGGDENAFFVRQGNKIIHQFFFYNDNTDEAATIIDNNLDPWREKQYTMRVDNGGIGYAIIDKLKRLGWRIIRTNNQSPAWNKGEFLNLGAQLYFHVRRLIANRSIVIPKVDKLQYQLTTRYFRGFDSTQGKYALEPKSEARACGRPSPDRADAFVLCFSSFRRGQEAQKQEQPKRGFTIEQLLALDARGELFVPKTPQHYGRRSLLSKSV